MTFTFTGLSYVFGFFTFFLLALRFWSYLVKEKNIVSRMFFYFGICFSVFALFTAVISLGWAENPSVLKLAVIQATFFQGVGVSALGLLLLSVLPRRRIHPR